MDTDFTALLADVEPSGYARFLTDGIVRARYRNSTAKAEPIVPGKIYVYNIDMWAIEQRVQGRASHTAVYFEQQFSEVQSEPEYRASRFWGLRAWSRRIRRFIMTRSIHRRWCCR